MIAASFWSLLAPAIELAESSGTYGAKGEYAFLPVAFGFLLGAFFVFGTDKIISYLGINSPNMMIGMFVIKNELIKRRKLNVYIFLLILALTHPNKDKAEIALDDTEKRIQTNCKYFFFF